MPVLSACGPAPGGADGANRATPTNTAAAANGGVAKARPVAPEPVPAPLVLEGAGLRIPGASPPRTVEFDTPEAATIEALARALGRGPDDRGSNEECGGGSMKYAAWTDDLTLWFLDGRFAGWDSKGRLKTAGGIGIGSSRAELAQLPGIEVEQSTLGTEFRAGGLSGILDSKSANARVTDLWGGATCVFR
jgi:hypothetical protein